MRAIDPNIKELDLRVYAKNQPEYLQLPARVDVNGTAVTCWKLSLRERLQMIWQGKFYLTILTFNNPLQPVRLDMELPKVGQERPSAPAQWEKSKTIWKHAASEIKGAFHAHKP